MTTAGRATRVHHVWPADVHTLAVDIGGSGFKAAVLDHEGTMVTERARVETPYPCPPETFVPTLVALAGGLGGYDRVSVGFPGLVRHGRVYNIPSLSRREYDGGPDPVLVEAWAGYDLGTALSE